MGRRGVDSVVARFTSFGSTHAKPNNRGVELQRLNSNGRANGKAIVQVPSMECLAHFPPLATPRAPLFCNEQLPSTKSDGPKKGPAFTPGSTPRPRFLEDATDAHSTHSSQSESYLHPAQVDLIRAQLADAQMRCQQLQSQLSASQSPSPRGQLSTRGSAASTGQQTAPAAGAGSNRSPANGMHVAAAPAATENNQHARHVHSSQQPQPQSTQHQQQLQMAAEKMAQVRQSASQLLAVFQHHGYEVAAGLDSLQDDLDELEQLGDAYKQRAQQAGGDPLVVRAAEALHTPPASPRTGQQGSPHAAPTPSTEKMVMLRARREHVEATFLQMCREMVSGLEGLVAACGPAPSS